MKIRQLEMISIAERDSVCEKTGLIRGAKLCGLVSRNGYGYPDSVHESAASRQLYVDLPIYEAHPNRENREGDLDRIPTLIGVVKTHEHRKGKGSFGDILPNLATEGGRRLKFAAENNVRNVGLSHEAHINQPEKDESGGMPNTDRIHEVAAMAMVDGPATTNGFFESYRDRLGYPVIGSAAMRADEGKKLGARIRSLREGKEMGLEEFASLVSSRLGQGKSIAASTLGNIERGGIETPSAPVMSAIARVLGVSVSSLNSLVSGEPGAGNFSGAPSGESTMKLEEFKTSYPAAYADLINDRKATDESLKAAADRDMWKIKAEEAQAKLDAAEKAAKFTEIATAIKEKHGVTDAIVSYLKPQLIACESDAERDVVVEGFKAVGGGAAEDQKPESGETLPVTGKPAAEGTKVKTGAGEFVLTNEAASKLPTSADCRSFGESLASGKWDK